MKVYLKHIAIFLFFSMLIFQCTTKKVEPIPADMRVQLSLLPDSGVGIAYINFKHLQNSAIYKSMADSWVEDELFDRHLKKIMDETDFDIRKDLDDVYVAILNQESLEDKNIIIVATGNFNQKKLIAVLKSHEVDAEFSLTSYKDQDLYTLNPEDITLCFPDSQTFIAAKMAEVKRVIDRIADPERGEGNRNWEALIDPVSYKSGAFFAMDMKDVLDEIANTVESFDKHKPLSALKAVENINISMKLEDKIFVSGFGNFKDEETAALFLDAFKGALATIKLSVSEERAIVDILNKIDISRKGQVVSIKFVLSEEEIEKLKDKQKRLTSVSF